MAGPVQIDYSHLLDEISEEKISQWQKRALDADEILLKGNGDGSDFLGWRDPSKIASKKIIADVKKTADKLTQNVDTLVVVGIGGSYLGARAVIEALGASSGRQVLFAGHCVSGTYMKELLGQLEGRQWAINIVSKSGTTTEPAIAFRILRDALYDTFGEKEANRRIVATTDSKKGALRKLAGAKKWKRFVIPDNVGGRFSVLTPVGLFPIAFAGIDIQSLVSGAKTCASSLTVKNIFKNPALFYAAARNILLGKGKNVELLANFDPRLHYVSEWWKQLYGESEGKDGMGLFPAAVDYTTDLHSMGQYVQDGRRSLFETFIVIKNLSSMTKVPKAKNNLDGLKYLEGMKIDEVNRRAYTGTAIAHRLGGVPNMSIIISRLDAENLGALLYFFERACGISGYMLGVNPFNQPGVEAYKTKMFALLGKPGYSKEAGQAKKQIREMGVGKNIVG